MKNSAYYRQVARDSLKNNWGNAVLVCLIVSLIVSTLSVTGIGSIVVFFVTGPLEVGLVYFFLKLLNKEKAEISDLFFNFTDNFMGNFLANILSSLYIALWSMLFIIPGIIKSFSYAMTMFIKAKNPTMQPNDAITLSRKMMKGNKFKLFCLFLSFIGWFILSTFTFGIGMLFLVPYVNTAKTAFFEDIYNNYVAQNSNDIDIKIEKPNNNESNEGAPEIIVE